MMLPEEERLTGLTSRTQRLKRLMRRMKESSITCSMEWLQACVDWIEETFSEGGGGGAISDENLFGHLKIQWVDANLEDMESKCLPPGLSEIKSITLPDKYGLQINKMQDIGESSYSQYNKIKKLENENTNVAATDSNEFVANWQPKPRRCLFLTLTDGTQKIFGMELENIPTLSLGAFKPGAKVMINGPVDCRKGVLHLKLKHVMFIGGEVEQLAETNSVANVLANALGTSGRDPLSLHNQTTQPTVHNQTTQQAPTHASTHTQIPPNNQHNAQSLSRNIVRNNYHAAPVVDLTDDQDGDIFDDDDDMFLDIDEGNLLNTVQEVIPSVIIPEPPQEERHERFPVQAPIQPVEASKLPWQYIRQIKDGLFKPGDVIQLRAVISTLLSNIKADQTSGNWNLIVNINDGSGFLVATISPDILDTIIGFTPAQMKQMKATKTPETKAAISKGMMNLTRTLVHLNGILRVRLTESQPIIISHSEITDFHAVTLAKRVDDCSRSHNS